MMAIASLERDGVLIREKVDKLTRLLHELKQIGITTGDTVTYIKMKISDATRQMSNSFGYNSKEHMDDIYEFRYEAHGGEYKLKCWHDGKEDTMHGAVDTQPEWLTGIVDVAKVAGHLKSPISPPPEAILWFHTDKNRNLINFIELAP
jgi:plastocyanin